MSVTIKGKTYKGKYKGPDKFKGDEKKLAAYYAAKKKAATTTKTTTTPTPVEGDPNPTQQSVYQPVDPNATAANANGTVQLQSNYEIDMAEADAQDAIDQQVTAAHQAKAAALITHDQQINALDKQGKADRGRLNSTLAYRGMTRGSTATDKSAALLSDLNSKKTDIESALTNANSNADNVILGAAAKRAAVTQRYSTARQNYTNSQSRTSPTEGSQAEDAGVSGTTIPASTNSATTSTTTTTTKPASTAKAVIGKPAEAKTYKGKYPGPDKFKGDKKKIAAWKAAKRKAKK